MKTVYHTKDVVSVLFNEPKLLKRRQQQRAEALGVCFSALQRAEIAEITVCLKPACTAGAVSVLFNEPKLLKQNT